MALDKKLRSALDSARMTYRGRFGPMPKPDLWVFIVGCYGSGTTLLNHMLATLPQVGSLSKEGQFLTDQLASPRDYGLARLWALQPERFCLDENSPDRRRADTIKRQWGSQFNDVSRPVLVEKSVPNMARIRWLERHFDPARFIAIVRSPFAVAESIRRKKAYPLQDCARQWLRSNEIMLRDLEQVSGKLVIRYEDLTENPNLGWREILAFIGIENTQGDISEREWQIHGRNSRITNMNARYLESMSAEDLAVVTRQTEPLLDRFGYRLDDQASG